MACLLPALGVLIKFKLCQSIDNINYELIGYNSKIVKNKPIGYVYENQGETNVNAAIQNTKFTLGENLAFCMTAFAICPFLFLAKVKK